MNIREKPFHINCKHVDVVVRPHAVRSHHSGILEWVAFFRHAVFVLVSETGILPYPDSEEPNLLPAKLY